MSEAHDGVEIVPVREAHRLDEAALARHLTTHLDGFEGPLRVSQFEGGQSNPTYLLQTPGCQYVMRKKPPGELLPSAHAVDREYRVMTALAETDVPVPETLLFVEDESIVGTPFFIMQRVAGRVLVDPLLPGLSAADRRALYDHFAEVLAALHTVDHEAVGLGDFGRPGSYYARQIGRWTKQYRASETEDIPAMDRLIEWLPENVPESDTVSIVHGDYRIGNCIVHPTEPRIVAVLDWELSTLGHPLADLSYACMGYHADLGHIESFIGIDFEATGIPTEAAFVARYCAATGREEIENWSFYVAFSLFRIAAIVQGVYKRGLDGIASSERAIGFKDDCRLRAEQAWELVRD
ncbi:MAG: phosphotransferase [Alphaproteobacteria bacterium]|nr:phosphotransferase [Alphaproteobacteria bacterium]